MVVTGAKVVVALTGASVVVALTGAPVVALPGAAVLTIGSSVVLMTASSVVLTTASSVVLTTGSSVVVVDVVVVVVLVVSSSLRTQMRLKRPVPCWSKPTGQLSTQTPLRLYLELRHCRHCPWKQSWQLSPQGEMNRHTRLKLPVPTLR